MVPARAARVRENAVPAKQRRCVDPPALAPVGPGVRALAAVAVAAALAGGLLALGWAGSASAQQGPDCEVNDLGTLGAGADAELTAAGRWSDGDCDSRFRTGSGAHTYSFEVAGGGRIRIDLVSAEADSFLYLLAPGGRRLADNDDGGAGLDARIERGLGPGLYIVEATTTGGRERGPADFSLRIGRATGCDPVHLGYLRPGVDLTASGSWTLDTCGSQFVVEHPAHRYLFELPQGGHVRVDLMSEDGDPVMSLISISDGLISANDDGGERRNSRIERYLQPGTYLVEATTYLERDYQPLRADFDLVIHLVDEKAAQESFLLKIEDVHAAERLVAGQPSPIHYRVGNLGGGGLADVGGDAFIYVVGPRVYEYLRPIAASEERWEAGVSYHTGGQTASATSVALGEVTPFEITLGRPGPTWVFVGVVTYDRAGRERGFHGQWQNLMVLSATAFDEVAVSVDGTEYLVEAAADADGLVTTTVSAVADAAARVDASVRARAIYAAGVRTQVLDGIFERPEVAELAVTGPSAPVGVESPSSSALLEQLADRYTDAIGASGLPGALSAQEALSPTAIEDLLLGLARSASAQYVSLAASWSALEERVEDGESLSFAEAFALHSEFAYAERVIAPAAEAGEIAAAARAADSRWQDDGVQEMLAALERRASCDDPGEALLAVLEERGVTDLDELVRLDAEMRVALPAYGLARDAALCTVAGADGDNSLFLEGLKIDDSDEILRLFGQEEPEAEPAAPPPPQRLRIVARLHEDGRIEHGVELADGGQILPSKRYLSSGAAPGTWRISSDVEVDGDAIGRIRSRRLDDGRVELGFAGATGETIAPDIRYLPADMPVGIWLRSAEIEVARQPAPEQRAASPATGQ